MSEDNQNAGGSTGSKAVTSDSDIVIDKNKPADQYIKEAEANYIIPLLVREKFPDLVKLIYETESMNSEEREYWMQIMPIMTEDQINKFRDILVNEKEQLKALDQEYEQEMQKINNKQVVEIDEEKLKEKLQKIEKAEVSAEQKEKESEEALLNQLENM